MNYKKNITKKIGTLTILLILILTSSCTGKLSRQNKDSKPIITVTIEPQIYFTKAIAGDKFIVNSLIPKGVSPESFDPTPQQLVTLEKSIAYLRIGYINFELAWKNKINSISPKMKIFDTSKGIDLIANEYEKIAVNKISTDTTKKSNNKTSINPHIWTSAVNALIIAKNTYKALCTLDKNDSAYYHYRYDSICKHIIHIDSIVKKILSSSQEPHSFLVYHPTLSYFARDYKLHQISIEEEGKEPSTLRLKELIEISKEEKVQVVLVQPEFDKRNAEIIAKQLGAAIKTIDPLNEQWDKEMINIANSLK